MDSTGMDIKAGVNIDLKMLGSTSGKSRFNSPGDEKQTAKFQRGHDIITYEEIVSLEDSACKTDLPNDNDIDSDHDSDHETDDTGSATNEPAVSDPPHAILIKPTT